MYFINRGAVQAILSEGGDDGGIDVHHVKLATLSQGAFFGEMALIDRSNPYRTASVISVTCCNFFMLELEGFEQVMAKHPDVAMALEKVTHPRRVSFFLCFHFIIFCDAGSMPVFATWLLVLLVCCRIKPTHVMILNSNTKATQQKSKNTQMMKKNLVKLTRRKTLSDIKADAAVSRPNSKIN